MQLNTSLKRYVLLFVLLLAGTSISSAQQVNERVKYLSKIQKIMSELPRSSKVILESTYDLKFDDEGTMLTLTVNHYAPGSDEKKNDYNVYLIPIHMLDANLIKVNENDKYHDIDLVFFTGDENTAIVKTTFIAGAQSSREFTSRLLIGPWKFYDTKKQILEMKDLFEKAIKTTWVNGKPDYGSVLKTTLSQSTTTEEKLAKPKQVTPASLTPALSVVEEMPLFQAKDAQGSTKKVDAYLSKKIAADQLNGPATIYVAFVINPEGAVERVRIINGFRKDVDDLIVSYIEEMPRWTPGKQMGKKVHVEVRHEVKL